MVKGVLKVLCLVLSLVGLTGAFNVSPNRLSVHTSPSVASSNALLARTATPSMLGKGAAKAKRIQKKEVEGDSNAGLAIVVFGGSIVVFIPFVLLGIGGQAMVEAGNTAAGSASTMFFL